MELDFKGKHILAPMVRVGTLPFRLLAAEYGAHIVYGEEIIDHRVINCVREENAMLGTVDIVDKSKGEVIFRTCELEKHRVVCQFGSSDAIRALTAAQLVCNDVAAIDLNMGCPKSFSISGGMGAALLSRPEIAHDILTTLRRNLNIPVTCKIRLLRTPEATVELARRLEKTGIYAIAVHGRKVADRPKVPAQWDCIANVVSALSIPVVANGDVFEYADFSRILEATGASSAMVARGAAWNVSVFQKGGKAEWETVKRQYLRKCIQFDNEIKSTKHTLKEMIMYHSCLELPEGKAINRSQNYLDLANMYDETAYYNDVYKSRGLI